MYQQAAMQVIPLGRIDFERSAALTKAINPALVILLTPLLVMFWTGLKTASANALCINASGANAVQAIVYYAQF